MRCIYTFKKQSQDSMPPCVQLAVCIWIFLSLSLSLSHTHTNTHTHTHKHTHKHTHTHTFPWLSRSCSLFLAAGNRFDESLNHVGGTSFYRPLYDFHFYHQKVYVHGKMYTHTYMAHFKAQSCASWVLHLGRERKRECVRERKRERGFTTNLTPYIAATYKRVATRICARNTRFKRFFFLNRLCDMRVNDASIGRAWFIHEWLIYKCDTKPFAGVEAGLGSQFWAVSSLSGSTS